MHRHPQRTRVIAVGVNTIRDKERKRKRNLYKQTTNKNKQLSN